MKVSVNANVNVNVRGGVALVAGTWTRWLSMPVFFFVLAVGWMVPPLTALLVWTAVAEEGAVGGLQRGELVAYYLALVAVTQLTRTENRYHVGGAIASGQLNALLLRPLPPLYEALAADVGYTAISLATVLPFVGVLALALHPALQPEVWQALCFLPALLAAWALSFSWSYGMALLAFWLQEVGALYGVQSALTFILAGQMAPVALLPDGLRAAAVLLPFRYMAAFPAEVVTGRLSGEEVVVGLCWQGGWLVVSVALAVVLWRQGVRRYAALGG